MEWGVPGPGTMFTCAEQPNRVTSPEQKIASGRDLPSNSNKSYISIAFSVVVCAVLLSTLAGCGTGGYIGGGIESLSRNSAVIDSGQSIGVAATVTPGLPLSWSLNGGACTGGACGSISATSGANITYTAPNGVVNPFLVQLVAAVQGTSSSSTTSITVNPDPQITGNPPSGTVNVAYTTTLSVSGGTAPLKLSQSGGQLPAGLTFNAATGVISGTPTASGVSTATFSVTDSSDVPMTVNAQETITIGTQQAAVVVISGTPGAGTVGTPYAAQLSATGGSAPYTWSLSSGALPGGLTLSPSTGLISGTPTTQGAFGFSVIATDANGTKASASFVINVSNSTSPLTLAAGSLPNGTVGVAYSSLIGISGGTSPYSCSMASGSLPAGLTLGSNCVVSGTPTTAGTQTVMVKVTDSASPSNTTTGPESITINPASVTLTLSSPPAGTAGTPYTGSIGVTGGSGPYTCSLISGNLPAGLTLNANCSLTGTPTTPGTSTVVVKGTDSSSPANSNTGTVSIVINPAAVTLTLSPPPAGTVGTVYTGSIGVTGGTAPYSCSLVSGSVPAGLTLNSNCSLTGTPTTAGTSTPTVKATDSANPANTSTGTVSIVINPAAVTLTLSSPPAGTVGTVYTGSIGVTGGTAPYSCSLVSGSVPAGLTLNSNCSLTGTPTTAGTSTPTVKATDSANPANTSTGAVSIVINPAAVTLTLSAPPAGTVGTVYTGSIGVTGGTAPYSCSLVSGAVPAGLTLNSNCSLTGTPTTAGTSTPTVKTTDSANPANTSTGTVSIVINPAAVTLTLSSPPAGTVGTVYTGSIGVTGGTAPYSCSLVSGSVPAGLTLNSNCSLTGTPTTAGTSTPTVKATDSANPANTSTGTVSIVINPAGVTLSITSPPAGMVGTPYTGSIGVTGGTAPYSCSLVSGSVPAGLTLNSNCSLTGTPTTAGTSTPTVKATDSANPANTSTGAVSIVINPAAVTLTLSSPPVGTVGTVYTGSIGVTGGTAPYSCSLVSGSVPAGLTLNSNCSLTGTPTTAGTSTPTVKATDSANPANTSTGTVSIVINPIAKLTLTLNGSLPYAILGQAYSQTLQASGGETPYTYTVTAGGLPPGITLSTAGVISGTPTQVGASSFTATVTDGEATPQTASLPLVLLVIYPTTPNDGALNGPYAYLFQGYDNEALAGLLSYQTATVGAFTANGSGVLTSGELDANHQTSTGTTVATQTLLGTYTIGSDYRGTMVISSISSAGVVTGTNTYAIAVPPPASASTASTSGTMVESDTEPTLVTLLGTAVITRGSGTFLAQTPSSFTTGLTGSYAFGLSGDTPCLPSCSVGVVAGPASTAGEFAVSGTSIAGTADSVISSAWNASATLGGSLAATDASGRLQMTMTTANTVANVYPTDYAVYMVDGTHAFVLSTDVHNSYVLLAGSMQQQTQSTFTDASFAGPFVGYENSPTNPGLVGTTLQNVLNLSTATIFRATSDSNGGCTTTNVDQGGTTGLANTLTGLGIGGNGLVTDLLGTYASTGSSNCPVASNGRTVFNYPAPSNVLTLALGLLGVKAITPSPRVVYLYSPGSGYFVETGYAGLGQVALQTGAPFGLGTLDGTYTYGTPPAASVAATDVSGVFTADGKGDATETLDENIFVSDLNTIDLDVTSNQTYTLNPNTTDGRYLLTPSSVIYAISPGSYVLLDTSALTTSPSIALIQ
jgi:hypothetical protein